MHQVGGERDVPNDNTKILSHLQLFQGDGAEPGDKVQNGVVVQVS